MTFSPTVPPSAALRVDVTGRRDGEVRRHGTGWGRTRDPQLVLQARERDGDYTVAPVPANGAVTPSEGANAAGIAALAAAVGGVRSVGVDELSESELAGELSAIEQACRQLAARQSRVVAALAARRSRRAREAARAAGRAEDAASQRASRELRRELGDELGWSPSDAKRSLDLGRRLEGSGDAGRAFDGGELSIRHAAVLGDTLRHIGDRATRDRAEAELLGLARVQDPVEFGRSCRRLLARVDRAGAESAEARRRLRRTARVWQREDGMTGFSAELSGLDAEVVTTAWHAFRRPDGAGERRSPEQVGADALVAMARAALDAGVAPHDRRTPPHVQVTIDWQAIVSGSGVPEGAWTGPLPFPQVRRLLADCGVSRLLMDADSVPVEAGKATRHVPVGLYRALNARDGGCIADGCDMPAVWCQVMHLETPFHLDGRLTLDTAALGCSQHHTNFDQHGWRITWNGRRPVLHHPDRPPPQRDGERTHRRGSRPPDRGGTPGAASQGAAERREGPSG